MDSRWFGQVRLIFTMRDQARRTKEYILVRWYDAAEYNEHNEHLSSSMRNLRWATTRVDSQQRVHWYDVKLLSDVIRPVWFSHTLHCQAFFNTTDLRRPEHCGHALLGAAAAHALRLPAGEI